MRGIAIAVAVLTLAGTAHAQQGPGGAPSGPGSPPPEIRGPDDRLTDFNRLRKDVADDVVGPTKSLRPVPVLPGDVTTGSFVHDKKGLMLGTVAKVGDGFAVIASPGGRIEVDFASMAKNKNGLLINMPKAKFDALVSGKPATK